MLACVIRYYHTVVILNATRIAQRVTFKCYSGVSSSSNCSFSVKDSSFLDGCRRGSFAKGLLTMIDSCCVAWRWLRLTSSTKRFLARFDVQNSAMKFVAKCRSLPTFDSGRFRSVFHMRCPQIAVKTVFSAWGAMSALNSTGVRDVQLQFVSPNGNVHQFH